MYRILAIAPFALVLTLGCASSSEPEPVPEPQPVVEVVPEPAPKPAPVAVPVAEPVRAPVPQLPKTASVLPLVGLTGAATLGSGIVMRITRRRRTRSR